MRPRGNNERPHGGSIERNGTVEGFYDAIFAAVGGKEGLIDYEGRLIYAKGSGIFMVVPLTGVPHATNGNGSAVAFPVTDPDQQNVASGVTATHVAA